MGILVRVYGLRVIRVFVVGGFPFFLSKPSALSVFYVENGSVLAQNDDTKTRCKTTTKCMVTW